MSRKNLPKQNPPFGIAHLLKPRSYARYKNLIYTFMPASTLLKLWLTIPNKDETFIAIKQEILRFILKQTNREYKTINLPNNLVSESWPNNFALNGDQQQDTLLITNDRYATGNMPTLYCNPSEDPIQFNPSLRKIGYDDDFLLPFRTGELSITPNKNNLTFLISLLRISHLIIQSRATHHSHHDIRRWAYKLLKLTDYSRALSIVCGTYTAVESPFIRFLYRHRYNYFIYTISIISAITLYKGLQNYRASVFLTVYPTTFFLVQFILIIASYKLDRYARNHSRKESFNSLPALIYKTTQLTGVAPLASDELTDTFADQIRSIQLHIVSMYPPEEKKLVGLIYDFEESLCTVNFASPNSYNILLFKAYQLIIDIKKLLKICNTRGSLNFHQNRATVMHNKLLTPYILQRQKVNCIDHSTKPAYLITPRDHEIWCSPYNTSLHYQAYRLLKKLCREYQTSVETNEGDLENNIQRALLRK